MIRRLAALMAALTLAACGGGGQSASSDGGSDSATTLNVIAGSELKDLEPQLADLRAKTGVTLKLTYSGTLAGIDRINAGEQFDGAWFSSDKYLVVSDTKHRIRASTRLMLSPVVLGVKASKAKALGWSAGSITWKQIADAAGAGKFTFGMTNPASSNSGFSAVIGVASAFAGTPDALRAKDVDTKALARFFAGQKLTSGSSGWLADTYVAEQDSIDGLVNYEASLLALNHGGKLHEQLTLIYPKEGTVTADYPFVLLDDAKRPLYDKVIAYFKGDDVQRTIMQTTYRRPVVPDVPVNGDFPKTLLVDVAFPRDVATINGILLRYLNEDRVPAHSYFVLDTSGSMDGDRIAGLQQAVDALAGDDPSLTGTFARFENREKVTFVSFSDQPRPPVDFELTSQNDTKTLGNIKSYVSSLRAGGATAIYDSIETAMNEATAERSHDAKRYYSIVLMTDGENNRGDSFDDFRRKYEALPANARIRVFPVVFGEGNATELKALADLTGGREFDGLHDSLSVVFKDIRGYQ